MYSKITKLHDSTQYDASVPQSKLYMAAYVFNYGTALNKWRHGGRHPYWVSRNEAKWFGSSECGSEEWPRCASPLKIMGFPFGF